MQPWIIKCNLSGIMGCIYFFNWQKNNFKKMSNPVEFTKKMCYNHSMIGGKGVNMEDKLEKKEISTTNRNTRKRRKRKLIILLLLLFATGIMLTTSTYAWFTANETVGVNTITVNIAAQNGIQVSADGTTWKSVVQTTDLTSVNATTYKTSVNQIPATLEPVSSGLNVSNAGKLEMFYGQVVADADGNWILSSSPSVETESNGATSTGKFVAFDLFFKSDTATNLYMTSNSKVTTTDTTDKGIKNATRIAYVILGQTVATDTVANIQKLGTENAASSPVYMWEPNYNVHTDAAIAHARDTYGLEVSATQDAEVKYDGLIAEIAADAKVKVGEANATKYSTSFKAVTPSYKTIEGNTDSTQIFGLEAGVTKVRIYMWVEGQDIDCENTASGGNVSFDLQFSVNA